MRMLQSLPDTELITDFHKGQERAFDILFLRYQEDVRKVIVRYVKDRWIAEDLSQDVFLKIYTSLKNRKYNEQGKFLHWALRIARNLCMDYLRKQTALPAQKQIVQEDWPSVSHNIENALTTKQQQVYLNCFINQLPDDQKKVVCYRYFEDLSFKEIALLMNTSVNTSLGRMRYGLMHLRKHVRNTTSFWQ